MVCSSAAAQRDNRLSECDAAIVGRHEMMHENFEPVSGQESVCPLTEKPVLKASAGERDGADSGGRFDALTTVSDHLGDRLMEASGDCGDVVAAQKRKPTLVVEQALINVRGITAPFEFNVGRRNYEDERHFLYDGSIDVASVSLRHEDIRAEAFVGRDVLWSLDLLQKARKVPSETMMLHADYRGFDNQILSLYAMRRHDMSGKEGTPITFGFRASGRPTPQFSYWSQFALLRGSDENGRRFSGRSLEVGATYRFASLPYDPNITLAYAFGSGDAGGERNTEFRQTGLHSNEAKFIGLAKFKAYGEMLDPELSNLKIATIGVGARATPGISIDLVYHRYRLDRLATEVRNWGLTALMNQPGTPPSKDVGQEVDLVVGFRGLFGVRRLGLDLRMGKFFPGKAFRTADGGATPTLRRADNGVVVVAKFRW